MNGTASITQNPEAEAAPAAGRLKRILRRRSLRFLFLVILLLSFTGCIIFRATKIQPPPAPADPVTVFLLDHGRTSSLVLPTPDGAMLRYVYGDWKWYALREKGFFSAVRAIFCPSQAGLGRHRYPGPCDLATVNRLLGWETDHIYPITVSRARVLALEDELDRQFRENISTCVVNTEYQLEFVQHPSKYYMFHDSNYMIARWLTELGCQVRGPKVYANWKME